MTSILVTATQFTSNLDSTHTNGRRRLFPPMRRDQGIAALMASRNIFNAVSPRLGAGWRENEDDYIEESDVLIEETLPDDETGVGPDVYALIGRAATFQHFARDVHLCLYANCRDMLIAQVGGTLVIRGATQLQRLVVSGRADTFPLAVLTDPVNALVGHCLELPSFSSLHFRNVRDPSDNDVTSWWFPRHDSDSDGGGGGARPSLAAPLRELTFANTHTEDLLATPDGENHSCSASSSCSWGNLVFARLLAGPYACTLEKLRVRGHNLAFVHLRELSRQQKVKTKKGKTKKSSNKDATMCG